MSEDLKFTHRKLGMNKNKITVAADGELRNLLLMTITVVVS
jgi:hypothetical protein